MYAKFEDLPQYQYKILEYLFSNENIWKLLYYNTPDALYQSNLTMAQKRALIYTANGNTYPQDTTIYRVFLTDLSDDMWNEQASFMRITLPAVFPTNRTEGILSFNIDVLVHTKIDMLNSTISRKVCLLSNILKSLNGAEIGGVGKLTFNRKLSMTDKAVSEGLTNGRSFSGYQITLSTNYTAG